MRRDREFIAQAKEFATSYVVAGLLEDIEAKHTEIWKNSSPAAREVREAAYDMIRAVQALRVEMQSIATDGEVTAWNKRPRSTTV